MKSINSVKSNETSLVNAAKDGDLELLRRLCSEGAEVDYQDSVDSPTALMTAAYWGNDECVNYLLSVGADIDKQDKDGRTALIFAVTMSRANCARVLIEYGANPNICPKNNWSPLYIACNKGGADIVKILVGSSCPVLPNVPRIEINIQNTVGSTPLMVACMHGHTEIVEILVQLGATLDMRDNNQWTATMKAADKGNTDIVKLLLERGADATAVDNSGFSSLSLAAKAGKPDTVKALLQHNRVLQSINMVDKNLRTALYHAAQNGHLRTVEELWRLGANPNIPDKNGNTATMVTKSQEIIDMLNKPPPPIPAQQIMGESLPSDELPVSGEKSGDVEAGRTEALQARLSDLAVSVRQDADLSGVSPMVVESEPMIQAESASDSKEGSVEVSGESDVSGLLSIEYSHIPLYLRSGSLFLSLSSDSEDPIQVPAGCFRAKDIVDSPDAFRQALKVMLFWGLSAFPRGVVKFCHENPISTWDNIAAETLHPDIVFQNDLKAIFRDDNQSVLVRAIEIGRAEVANYLIEARHDNLSTLDKDLFLRYVRLLHENKYPWDEAIASAAASTGNMECLVYVHEHGCPWDVNTHIEAARNGHLECMSYAHDHGLQLSAAVCSAAADGGQLACLKYIRQQGCPWDKGTLNAAVKHGRVDLLRYMMDSWCPHNSQVMNIAAGAPPGCLSDLKRLVGEQGMHEDGSLCRALDAPIDFAMYHIAAYLVLNLSEDTRVDAEQLVLHILGPPPDPIDRVVTQVPLLDHTTEEHTPLMEAAAYGQLGVANQLIRDGAIVDKQDKDGRTALHHAIKHNKAETVRLLLDWGANKYLCTKNGWSPLFFATQKGFLETMEILLDYEAEVDTQNKEGGTALMVAAKLGNVAAVLLLLQHGAVADIRNDMGFSALRLATEALQPGTMLALLART